MVYFTDANCTEEEVRESTKQKSTNVSLKIYATTRNGMFTIHHVVVIPRLDDEVMVMKWIDKSRGLGNNVDV